MLFRRLVVVSLLVGFVSGLVLTLAQQWKVAPIIFAAEVYEIAEAEPVLAAPAMAHSHEGVHVHDEQAWAPQEGAERFLFSMLSNVLLGIGFSVLLMAIMGQLQLSGMTRLTPLKGVFWGVGGFIAFFAAPSLGLPPEIPGLEAAPLENRQAWWALTVLVTGVGLALLAFGPRLAKAGGLALLLLPHLVGAPHMSGPEFIHPDPLAVQALMSLHSDFIVASILANGVFWSVLGLMSAWMLNKWVLKGVERSA